MHSYYLNEMWTRQTPLWNNAPLPPLVTQCKSAIPARARFRVGTSMWKRENQEVWVYVSEPVYGCYCNANGKWMRWWVPSIYISIIEQQQVYANNMDACCISRQTKQYTNSRWTPDTIPISHRVTNKHHKPTKHPTTLSTMFRVHILCNLQEDAV